jgi:MHS family proline/betaine transporter-like MFS transporter
MPSVDTEAEARELVKTQDENPLINVDELPFDAHPHHGGKTPVGA